MLGNRPTRAHEMCGRLSFIVADAEGDEGRNTLEVAGDECLTINRQDTAGAEGAEGEFEYLMPSSRQER